MKDYEIEKTELFNRRVV